MRHTTRLLSHVVHDRGVRLGAGLAVAVAIPVAVLFFFQFRSLSDLEATSAVVLRQLSGDTAGALARAAEDHLKRPYISVLLRIPQARTEPLDLTWIDPIFKQGMVESPFIEAFYVWSETGPSERVQRWWTFDRRSFVEPDTLPPTRFREDEVTGARLLPKLHDLVRMRRAIVAFSDTFNGRRYYIQAQLRFETPARDRMTSVVAFAVDAEQLRTTYMPALFRQHAAQIQQPTGFPNLETVLFDEHGVRLFASPERTTPPPPQEGDRFVDERAFPVVFFDKELLEFAAPYEEHREVWRLRTGYGPQTIPEVVSASTRPQMALMVVLAAIMGLGVFLVAGAAVREVRVAEIKSNFVASVSHDLKTPLALIQLFAETLELGRVRTPERAQEYYRIINGEAKKLTRLIENILDFSRMEAGLRPYRMAPVGIGELVTQVMDAMAPQIAQGQFTVTASIDPGLPRVLADGDAVEQAVENLLANAMKYSGEKKTIEVSVTAADGHVVVGVRDHGIGIPRREQRRIFRKFYRVQQELGGGPQGTGLGLAIVDHTMRGHGGYVRVASTPERGSTFTLHFPIPADPARDPSLHLSDHPHRSMIR
jgi:signal transduction histidine kinase